MCCEQGSTGTGGIKMNETQTQTKRSTKTGTSLYNAANGERDGQDAAAETIWFNDREQTAAHGEMYLYSKATISRVEM